MKPSKTLGALGLAAALNALPACSDYNNDPCSVSTPKGSAHLERPQQVMQLCAARKNAALSCIELNDDDTGESPVIHHTGCNDPHLGAVLNDTFEDEGSAHYGFCVEGVAKTDCDY